MAEGKKQANSVKKVSDNTENIPVNEPVKEPARPDAEFYADGILGLSIRSGVLKVDFYQSVAPTPDGKSEFRRLSQRVAMPLTAITELKAFINQIEAAIAKKS